MENLKKSYKEKVFPSNTEERDIRLIHDEERRIMMYEHLTSPLIKPQSDFIIDFQYIFAHRSFRLPTRFHSIQLQEFTDNEIEDLLNSLVEKYSSNQELKNNEQEQKDQEKPLTPHEKN